MKRTNGNLINRRDGDMELAQNLSQTPDRGGERASKERQEPRPMPPTFTDGKTSIYLGVLKEETVAPVPPKRKRGLPQSTLSLWTSGDRSVGINGATATVIFDDDFAYDADFKRAALEAFREVFENLNDEKAYAEWLSEDRCRECGFTPETGACFYCKAD